ncbi:MAG: translation elongation factor 4 [Patescibacteria group bacterium]
MLDRIRNFCIIAHIDHGKSTLADRLLELTHTVSAREMKSQLLDQMDIERERGITIKLQPVRMKYTHPTRKEEYTLNLIDTPGHVDFTYEVSRSLAAVEGALLLVDCTQGVQAQTLANLYLALEQNLEIIPVLNKIDLPAAEVEKTREEIKGLIGCRDEDIILASGKTGAGVEEILQAIVERVPPPKGAESSPLRALIFDSYYDEFRGVVASVRVIDGAMDSRAPLRFIGTGRDTQPLDVGYFTPKFKVTDRIATGEIGMLVTGLKDLKTCRVGDTITLTSTRDGVLQLEGYKEIKPMVFAGIFPKEGDGYSALRDAMERLVLSDSSLQFEPEHSRALGYGFRCGFLGLLHLEIVQERLRREHHLEITATIPSVAYRVSKNDGEIITIKSPQDLPEQNHIRSIEEPWMNVDIVTTHDTIGNVMTLVQEKHGEYITTEFLASVTGQRRVILHYRMPLAAILVDFYDKLKSVSSGYASLNYEFFEMRPADIIRLDIMIADEPVEALATLVWREEAFHHGKIIVEKLKGTLPQQMFVIKIQATIGGKVIASERISALRKDVTAKLYGGDVTRKRKLLEKQKKGKKKMMEMGAGKVDIPPEAYLAVLRRS